MKKNTGITVTKTYLPSLAEYTKYLEKIWESGWITNHGVLVHRLEKKLKDYLGVKHLFFVSNGTVALQIAVKSLNLKGEVITTPFSYVATTSSLVWEGCKPVFADIKKDSFVIDPREVEKKITSQTSAIMATHVYGNSCDVEQLERIAKKHNLKIIYDGAHAFGVSYKGRSLSNYGDITTMSFHATKLFHTGEGGALVTNNDKIAHNISYMRNFGHNGEESFYGVGINGKQSEFHAAMGLSVLPQVQKIIERRKNISQLYNVLLEKKIVRPVLNKFIEYNYAYYPVLFESEKQLLRVKDALNNENIFPRRYFYPSLHTLHYVKKQKTPISEDISPRILCLPLYYNLKIRDVNKISKIILKNL